MLLYACKAPHRFSKVYTARSLEKAHQVTYWLRLCNGGNCVQCANVTFYDVQRHCDCFLASWRSLKSKVNGGCCNSAAANEDGVWKSWLILFLQYEQSRKSIIIIEIIWHLRKITGPRGLAPVPWRLDPLTSSWERKTRQPGDGLIVYWLSNSIMKSTIYWSCWSILRGRAGCLVIVWLD